MSYSLPNFGVNSWEEGELRGGQMLMPKVRNLAPAPLVIYKTKGSNATGNSACGGH
jgi:hypothetical protein